MAIVFNQRVIVGTIVDVYPGRTVGKEDHSVVNFTVAVTPSERDGDNGWKDGETEFVRCTAWRRLADNVIESFNKGDRIIMIGRQTMDKAPKDRDGNSVKDKDGNVINARPNFTADYVGVDITFDPAHSEREAKNETSAKTEGSDSGSSKKSSKSKSKNSDKKGSSKKKETKKEENIFDDDDDDIFGDDDDIFGDDD